MAVHQTVTLTNFRSYDTGRFELDPRITLVVGPNASGKTNLLESLYVLSTTKSFRAKDRDLVRHEQNHYRVVVTGEYGEVSLGFEKNTGQGTKKLAYDGAKQSLASHIGRFAATLFEPSDLDLLHGAPEQRRRYLDGILCQTDATYLRTMSEYRRVLKQRNSLLDGFSPEQIKSQIFAWDVRLAGTAADIYTRRLALIAELNQLSPGVYERIAREPVAFTLSYQGSVAVPADDYADAFLQALERNLLRDLAVGFTTIGPHREDFKVKFRESDITSVASRGEVRTAILALKLAEIGYIERTTSVKPILLLDDVFSELDRERRIQLLGQLDGYQTIITTTDADHIRDDLPSGYSTIYTSTPATEASKNA